VSTNGHLIDLGRWKRRQHFDLYRALQQPFFSVTVNVEVTALWQRCRTNRDASFVLSALAALLRAAAATEPMRLRLRGDEVWLHDRVGVGTTVSRPDETFGFARLDLASSEEAFQLAGRAAIEQAKQSASIDPMPGQDDLIYHTTLPWLRFTAFTNALSGSDSIPRVTFGKVFEDRGGFRMPVAVEVHHALVDGLDVARFIDAFEAGVH
jgi:chloramphenicol O-acetyltransferase type A